MSFTVYRKGEFYLVLMYVSYKFTILIVLFSMIIYNVLKIDFILGGNNDIKGV